MSLKVAVLEREEVNGEILSDIAALGASAKKDLGYPLLEERIGLRQALKALEIHPFSEVSVSAYKAARIEEVWKGLYGTAAQYRRFAAALATIYLLLYFVAGIVAYMAWQAFGGAWGWAGCLVCASTAILCVLRAGMFYNMDIAGISGWRWELTSIAKYREPIPEFVLHKMLEIRRRAPLTNFFIDFLDEGKDPFLVAEGGEERFWIEVWKEPRFENTL